MNCTVKFKISNMNEIYKAGDVILATKSCSGAIAGNEYVVDSHGFLSGTSCNCGNGWQKKGSNILSVNMESFDYPINKIEEKNKKTIMKKINTFVKKLIDSDTQKLIEARFISEDLSLTSCGIAALQEILFFENKAKMVEKAKEIIAEEEKETK